MNETTHTNPTPDFAARQDALRNDAKAVATRTRDCAAELWKDLGKLAKESYELVLAWVEEKRAATPAKASAPAELAPEAAPVEETPEAAPEEPAA